MRSILAALAACVFAATAAWGDCHPNALGTARTIAVEPAKHGRIGTIQYAETLPLDDKEVVLTFDDGPLPPYSNRVLDILAAECTRATFFIVGRQARQFPELVRRIYGDFLCVCGQMATPTGRENGPPCLCLVVRTRISGL